MTLHPRLNDDQAILPQHLDSEPMRDPISGCWDASFLSLSLRARLAFAAQRNRTVVVAYADLDNFRAFNDLWGNLAGDGALRAVGSRLRSIQHNGSAVEVTRLGRDEFVVLAESHADAPDSLQNLGDALIHAVQQPIVIADGLHNLTMSVGLTESNAESTCDSLLLEARLSLQNKRRKNECVSTIYDRTSGPNADYVRSLPRALSSGEISCSFQPQVDVRTGQIMHVEALARWTRPSGEVVPPSAFVPCAESYGLAPDLTRAVLRSVSSVLTDSSLPGEMRVWINLSACEMDFAEFPATLLALLDEVGTPASRIGVEITESDAVRDPLRLAADIAELQRHDVVVAIDDFGSGYSPLGYLRMLSPDVVKLDRSLISYVDADSVNQRLIDGILGVLNELGIDVIAEGVERLEEQQWLESRGVHHVQGYLWCPPVHADTARQWLKADAGALASTD